jgi:hypothetical protein
MSYHADDYLDEQVDDRDAMVAQAIANILRHDIEALKDLVRLSDKHADLSMLNIIKNHLAAMRHEVQTELKARR